MLDMMAPQTLINHYYKLKFLALYSSIGYCLIEAISELVVLVLRRNGCSRVVERKHLCSTTIEIEKLEGFNSVDTILK